MSETILITGSNRGIGLALVKEYAKRDTTIFATCRKPAEANELQQLAQEHDIHVLAMDINDEASISAAFEHVQAITNKIDLLINNAGIYPQRSDSREFGQLKSQAVGNVVTTNSVSPMIVTQAFHPLLKQAESARVVMISSHMGSIENASGSSVAYRMSKAAMNMGARILAHSLRRDSIIVITTHPGHVATDMGGSSAPVSPEDSARGLIMVIDNLRQQDSGEFFDWRGEKLPW